MESDQFCKGSGNQVVLYSNYTERLYHIKERFDLFCITPEGRSRQMGRFQLKVKKDFLTIRIVPLWIQLPCKLGKFSVTRSMASRNQPSLGGEGYCRRDSNCDICGSI